MPSSSVSRSRSRSRRAGRLENYWDETRAEAEESSHRGVDVKVEQKKGKIKMFVVQKAFGFILLDGPKEEVDDLFFHVVRFSRLHSFVYGS